MTPGSHPRGARPHRASGRRPRGAPRGIRQRLAFECVLHDGLGADGVDRSSICRTGSTTGAPDRSVAGAEPAQGGGARVGRRPQPARPGLHAWPRCSGGSFDVEVWGARVRPLRRRPVGAAAPARAPRSTPSRPRASRSTSTPWRRSPTASTPTRSGSPSRGFPSLALGVLAKEARNRPLVLDVDDHELAFFTGAEHGLELAGPRTLRHRRPAAALRAGLDPGLRAAHRLRRRRRQCRTSRSKERYGGTIVPHATRRAAVRSRPLHDRDETRAATRGSVPTTASCSSAARRAVHKGVVEVLQALERSATRATSSACSTTRELDELRGHRAPGPVGRCACPHQPFDRARRACWRRPTWRACCRTRPTPSSRYQLPAKVTDALAMGVPCLVTADPAAAAARRRRGRRTCTSGAAPLHERDRRAIFDDA